MFNPRPGIVISFLICVLTLSLECFGSTDTVKNWEEDKTQPNLTTKSPRSTTYRKQTRTTYNYDLLDDRGIFFLILGFGVVTIAILLLCFFQKKRTTTPNQLSFNGATVHPPPTSWRTTTVGSVLSPHQHSYDNTGFASSNLNVNHLTASEVDSNPADRPPPYATLVLSDLGSHPEGLIYPSVRKIEETPPPIYTGGRPDFN